MKPLKTWLHQILTLFNPRLKDEFGILDILKVQPIFFGLENRDFQCLLKYVTLTTISQHDVEKIQQEINPKHLFIILNGSLNAVNRLGSHNNQSIKEARYEQGEILNLLALANPEQVVEIEEVLKPTTLIQLDLENFRKDRKHPRIQAIIMNNMANYFSERLHYTEQVLIKTSDIAMKSIEKQFEEEKLRVLFGMFVIRMFIILCIYTISLRGLEILEVNFGDPAIVSTSLLLIVSVFVFKAMMKTGLSLKEFGLTTEDWRLASLEGIGVALLLCLVLIFLKMMLILALPEFQNMPLFEFNTGLDKNFQVVSWKQLSIMLFYILFSPLQEFLVRGGLQSSLFSFLSGSYHFRVWISILVSNLIFVTFHSHISFIFSILTFLPGLAWGWLYARHKTLIGVSISHILLGVLGVFMVGISGF